MLCDVGLVSINTPYQVIIKITSQYHILVKFSGLTDVFISGRTGLGVDSASNRNEYQESLKIKKPGGKVQLAHRADNLAAIY
jgi:hypothetical protein